MFFWFIQVPLKCPFYLKFAFIEYGKKTLGLRNIINLIRFRFQSIIHKLHLVFLIFQQNTSRTISCLYWMSLETRFLGTCRTCGISEEFISTPLFILAEHPVISHHHLHLHKTEFRTPIFYKTALLLMSLPILHTNSSWKKKDFLTRMSLVDGIRI